MDDFDSLLERAKEESLRIFNEVEVPRRALENGEACSKDNGSNEDVEIISQGSPLYKGKEAEGFHLMAGKTYVYPSNFAIRKYQADIVPTALFHNTLVCLPTGLGKTFIAAVVMYNFYRWYPVGKVIFMAPTKPLVAQQMKACRDIMAIPADDTFEMTGSTSPQERQELWKIKRVLFLTPQVMINDLRNNLLDPSLIKCLVIDEAHRATKGYAYCQVVQHLFEAGVLFRLVALSATPGSDVKAIKEVIQNLRIEKMEVRSEDCADVTPYIYSKLVDKVVVELSPFLKTIWNKYLQIYGTYYRRIRDTKVLTANITSMTKFQVLVACRKFNENPPSTLPKHVVQMITADFNVCVSLAHARELLENYGLRTFYNYFIEAEKSTEKGGGLSRLCHDPDLRSLLAEIKDSALQDVADRKEYIWSHPKFKNLVDVIKSHFSSFNNSEEQTKAIVFCQFRLVVSEAFEVLKKFVPEVKPVMFIGQGGKEKGEGLPQKKQLEVMKMFRSGDYNVLIATCVAEEGLDIGNVDLLVLMEAHRSPVRLVQRLGRTGRHKNGRCVVLLTKGMEEKKFSDGMSTHKNYMNIVNSPQVLSCLHKYSPKMIPNGCDPKRQLLHVKVPDFKTPGKKKKKQADIRKIINNASSMTRDVCLIETSSPVLDQSEMDEFKTKRGSYETNSDGLPTKELLLRNHEESPGLWSVVGSSKKPPIQFERKLVHIDKNVKENISSGGIFSTASSKKSKKGVNSLKLKKSKESKGLDDIVNVDDIDPVTEIEENLIVVNDNINNLLDNALKDYENIYHEFERTCALGKNVEISDCLNKYLIPVIENTKSFDCLSIELLNGITGEDITNIDVKVIFSNSNKSEFNCICDEIVRKQSEMGSFSTFDDRNAEIPMDFYENVYDDTPENLVHTFNNSPGFESDEDFIGIDDLLKQSKDTIANKKCETETSDLKCFLPSSPPLSHTNVKKDLFKDNYDKKTKNIPNNGKISPVLQHTVLFTSILKPAFKKPFLNDISTDTSLKTTSDTSNNEQISLVLNCSQPLSPLLKPISKKCLFEENTMVATNSKQVSPLLKGSIESGVRNKNDGLYSNLTLDCKITSDSKPQKTDNVTDFVEIDDLLQTFVSDMESKNKCNPIPIPQLMPSESLNKNSSFKPNVLDFTKEILKQTKESISEVSFTGTDNDNVLKSEDSFNMIVNKIKPTIVSNTHKINSSQNVNLKNKKLITAVKHTPVLLQENETKFDNKISKDLKTISDESSQDSSDFIPGTPENKIPLSIWNQSPEMLNDISSEFGKKISPILSGRPTTKTETPDDVIITKSNTNRSVSPILSGRYCASSFSQLKCSTPITTVDKNLLKKGQVKENTSEMRINVLQNFNGLNKPSAKNVNKPKKNLFCTENNSNTSDSSDCNELWEIDDVFKDSFNYPSKDTPHNRLSYYLNGDSMYTVTQLVEKAEELEKGVQNNGSIESSDKATKKIENPYEFNKIFQKSDADNKSSTEIRGKNIIQQVDTTKISSNFTENVEDNIKHSRTTEPLQSEQLPIEERVNKKSKDKKYNSKFILWDSSEDEMFTNLSPVKDSVKKNSEEKENLSNKENEIINCISVEKNNVLDNFSMNGVKKISDKIAVDRSNENINLFSKESKINNVKSSEKDYLFDYVIDLTLLDDDDDENCITTAQKKNLSVHKKMDSSLNTTFLFPVKQKNPFSNPSSARKTPLLSSNNCQNGFNSDSENSDPKLKSRAKTIELAAKKSNSKDKDQQFISPFKSVNKTVSFDSPSNRSGGCSSAQFASKSKTLSDFSDSDSDVFIQQKRKRIRMGITASQRPKKKRKKEHLERKRSDFIETEAEVSGETSSGAETSGLDSLDESFIDDFSQKPENSMYGKYCEAVKNTDRVTGGFKIPQLSVSVMERNVFSQAVPVEHESYVNDSFCVVSSESNSDDDQMSYLERAEKMLEEELKRRGKKMKKKKSRTKKKKRKRPPSLSGSETDFEEPPCIKLVNNNNSDDSLPIISKKKKRRVKLLSSSGESN